MKRTALITGAADGIGKASAEIFLKAGYDVAAVDVDPRKLERCAQEFQSLGTYLKVRCDVTVMDDIREAVKQVADSFGRIDVLVNNAGGGLVSGSPTPDEMDTDLWDRIVQLNLYSVFHFTQEVLPIMKEQKYGRIVCVTSVAGRGRSLHGNVAYASSKAAVHGFARHASRDLGPYGITINCVAPALIMTDRVKAVFNGRTREQQDEVMNAIVVNRAGEAMDAARLVYLLGAEDAGYITGAVMDVNGGCWVG